MMEFRLVQKGLDIVVAYRALCLTWYGSLRGIAPINWSIRTGIHARVTGHPVIELGWSPVSHAALGSLTI